MKLVLSSKSNGKQEKTPKTKVVQKKRIYACFGNKVLRKWLILCMHSVLQFMKKMQAIQQYLFVAYWQTSTFFRSKMLKESSVLCQDPQNSVSLTCLNSLSTSNRKRSTIKAVSEVGLASLTLRIQYLTFLKKYRTFRWTGLLRSSKLVHLERKNSTCFT